MGDTQILTIALAAVPTMLAVLVGILINNSRLSDTSTRIADTNANIRELRGHMDNRFTMWISDSTAWIAVSTKCATYGRSELYRVEQVIDARLKHLEERG